MSYIRKDGRLHMRNDGYTHIAGHVFKGSILL